jgi:hypothetical protein
MGANNCSRRNDQAIMVPVFSPLCGRFPNVDVGLGLEIKSAGEAIYSINGPKCARLLAVVMVALLLQRCGRSSTCPCTYYAPNCCVSISNESGLDLRAVEIRSANGARSDLPVVQAGTDTAITLAGKGEDMYNIMAFTMKGDTIRGSAMYYESGYWINNRILEDTILTEVKF